jgi:hypothetical protein
VASVLLIFVRLLGMKKFCYSGVCFTEIFIVCIVLVQEHA